MSPAEEAKAIAFNSIRTQMENAGLKEDDIEAFFTKISNLVAEKVEEELTDEQQGCDYEYFVNEFAQMLSYNNQLITADDYDNIFVTIDNT